MKVEDALEILKNPGNNPKDKIDAAFKVIKESILKPPTITEDSDE